MNELGLPFIPGRPLPGIIPLQRFYPPFSSNTIPKWLETVNNGSNTSWVLDPFGSHPFLPIEAAAAGYKVLFTCNNPITRCLVQALSNSPQKNDLQGVLSELLNLRRGEDRLERHLIKMYQTECQSCHEIIQVDRFLWKLGDSEPYARQYSCPHCGDHGEKPIQEFDRARLNSIGNDSLDRSRAIQRVIMENAALKNDVEDAITIYSPRQLDFLMTIINKLDGLTTTSKNRNLLDLILIHLFNQGCILWNWPPSRSRPKSLQPPNQYREENLWKVLNQFVNDWTINLQSVSLTYWPDIPSGMGGICIFPGRMKDLPHFPDHQNPGSIVAAVPRPNHAFWTLSAIWSGWLWGSSAAEPLIGTIDRKRYDWKWHTLAMANLFSILSERINKPIPAFFYIPDLTPGFLSGVLCGANNSGMELHGLGIRDEQKITQSTWKLHASGHKSSPESPDISNSIQSIFSKRNEPLTYVEIYAHIFSRLVKNNFFKEVNRTDLNDQIDLIESDLNKRLRQTTLFKRYGSESQSLESGSWWINDRWIDRSTLPLPLSDRIEKSILEYLMNINKVRLYDLDLYLCNKYPDVLTPSNEIILRCLESYSTQPENSGGVWFINPKETIEKRQADTSEVIKLLIQIGKILGFSTEGQHSMHWKDEDGAVHYSFFITTDAVISKFLTEHNDPIEEVKKIIVLPGSRSNLVWYKLKKDGRLEEIFQKSWNFIKFRHIRRMSEWTSLNRVKFDELLDQDPLLWKEATQMAFFDTD